jgi:MtfA peptidase
MGNSNYLLSVLRYSGITLVILGYLYFQVRFSDAPFVKRNFKKYLILRNLENVYKPFLSQYFTFYNSLGSEDKLLFERRVQKFIDIKEFISRDKRIEVITPEMKAMIAGSSIQLTFGYPDVYFRHFDRILLYSDSYYSTITHKYHMGEVSINGIIVLSWKGFKEGFKNPSDGRNLGFHEMAHALRLINIVDNEEYDFYDRQIMDEFDKEAQKETLKILNKPDEVTFFRNYIIPNTIEFFSVAIECFFEKSIEFRNYNPKLYTLLTRILKIDPIVIYSSNESGKMA